MFTKSGYGKLRDIFSRKTPDSPYIINLEDDSGYNIESYYRLQENIKSKYIEEGDDCGPIIASKSISVKNNINYINRTISNKSDNELIYTYNESNIYPCRNYDLLDIKKNIVSVSDSNQYKDLFFNKLIMYNNRKLFAFENYGPLYNISPKNIPVLTKMIAYDNNEIDQQLHIIFTSDKLIKNVALKDIITIDHVYNKNIRHYMIIYEVKEHVRPISTIIDSNINAYIPKCIITIDIVFDMNNAAQLLKNFNDFPNKYNNYNKQIANINEMLIATVLDYNLRSYIIWKCNQSILNDNNYKCSILEQKIMAHKNNINKLKKSTIIGFPFGNVHDNYTVCNLTYKMTELMLDVKHIKEHNNTIDFADIINSSYVDFFDSNFNNDLKIYNFIEANDYDAFLKVKQSHSDKTFDNMIKRLFTQNYNKVKRGGA